MTEQRDAALPIGPGIRGFDGREWGFSLTLALSRWERGLPARQSRVFLAAKGGPEPRVFLTTLHLRRVR